ncbi:MAG: hypothetical protein EPN98_21300 [Phenylobacterium sp.]|uniref:hypothetical protein n=1 Tax=Phenylobacterium sp. TaxID=1871053 RepID=UPI0011FE0607|nr:hypothetical protein [Phenylobacterium sp.]TAL28981.1 MAG: hypothetical protein EPN98_21300 [Phenylobacterium sp.]
MRVPLTDPELIAVGADLSALITKEAAVEAEKKAVTKVFSDQLKELHASIMVMNQSIATKSVEREVEVRIEEDHLRGVIRTIRLDTNQIENERPMDDEERQLKLDAGLKKAREAERKGQAPTEEQTEAATPQEAEEMRERRLRRERRERAIEAIDGVISDAIVLPCETNGEHAPGFRAMMAARPPLWLDAVEAKGDTEHEARSILRDKIVDVILAAEDAVARAKTERIMERLAELLPNVVVSEVDGGFVAKVDAGTWLAEAEGVVAEEATGALRQKLIEILREQEEEIGKLATAQSADDGVERPRGLKATKALRSKKKGGGKAAGDGEAPGPSPAPEVDTTPPPDGAF